MKLKKERFRYENKKGWQSFEVVIEVSTIDGKFYFKKSDIPVEITAVSEAILDQDLKSFHEKYCTGELSSIPYAIKKAIKNFEETLAVKEETKVIVYRFDIVGELIPDTTAEDGTVIKEGLIVGNRRTEGLNLGFDWQIATKVTTAGFKNDRAAYLIEKWDRQCNYNFDEDEYRVIPWTEERETWFKNIETNFRNLLLNIHKFMELTGKDAENVIDSKPGFLMIEQRKEEHELDRSQRQKEKQNSNRRTRGSGSRESVV